MTKKKVVISIIAFNNNQATNRCLASLDKLKTNDLDVHIVIIDNGLEERFTNPFDSRFPIRVLRNDENKGFTGGHNQGIAFAKEEGADFLMLLNNDTTVKETLLLELLDGLEKKDAGVAVPKIYFAKGHEFHKDRYEAKDLGKVLWYAGGDIDWDHIQSRHRGMDEVDHGQCDQSEIVGFATGCCLLITREVLEKVGLLDDRYFLYYEDADFSERVKRVGFSLVYLPQAVVYHSNAISSEGPGGAIHDYFLTRNQMLFGMKFAPIRSKLALVRQSFRFLFSGRKWQRRGVIDFYLGRFGKGSFLKK